MNRTAANAQHAAKLAASLAKALAKAVAQAPTHSLSARLAEISAEATATAKAAKVAAEAAVLANQAAGVDLGFAGDEQVWFNLREVDDGVLFRGDMTGMEGVLRAWFKAIADGQVRFFVVGFCVCACGVCVAKASTRAHTRTRARTHAAALTKKHQQRAPAAKSTLSACATPTALLKVLPFVKK